MFVNVCQKERSMRLACEISPIYLAFLLSEIRL